MALGVHPAHCQINASRWCITREDLRAFEKDVRTAWHKGEIPDDVNCPNPYHDDPAVGPNIYRVCEHFIKPRTMEAGGMSWALMRHPQGLPCDVFVSHSWAEGIFEFVAKVEKLWPAGMKALYCCFLSNPQNGDVSAMLGNNPMTSPFAVALASAEYFLVVPNRRQSIYSRLWCVFEAHLAILIGLKIRLPSAPTILEICTALVPRFCLFLVCFFACLKLDLAAVPEVVAYTRLVCVGLAPLLGLCLEPTLNMFSNFLSWMRFPLAGCLAGVLLTGGGRDMQASVQPWVMEVMYFGSCSFMVLGLLERTVHSLVAQIIGQESCLVQYDSVRHARCADEADELRLRKIIRGSEDAIDEAIKSLMTLGRYDHYVRKNLQLGLPAARIRDGVLWTLVFVYAFIITGGILGPWCTVPWFPILSQSEFIGLYLFVYLIILVSAWAFFPQPNILAYDALVVAGCLIYVLYDLISLIWNGSIDGRFLPSTAECRQVPWWTYYSALAAVFLAWYIFIRMTYASVGDDSDEEEDDALGRQESGIASSVYSMDSHGSLDWEGSESDDVYSEDS
eukprot:TRINITY_DN34780_c0_g1_i1.p1 TRINITY_DN34780_c0_g1~~TRINITY_DN34780_c0_g1_i1.p1  ORF type:complete len:563 (+),score=28.52 TRINITY_DN34780_c0_g1_i1:109-1797(+)